MSVFVKFKNKKGKEFVINADHIIGFSPLKNTTAFGHGGQMLVRGAGKGGVNLAFELSPAELTKVFKALGIK